MLLLAPQLAEPDDEAVAAEKAAEKAEEEIDDEELDEIAGGLTTFPTSDKSLTLDPMKSKLDSSSLKIGRTGTRFGPSG